VATSRHPNRTGVVAIKKTRGVAARSNTGRRRCAGEKVRPYSHSKRKRGFRMTNTCVSERVPEAGLPARTAAPGGRNRSVDLATIPWNVPQALLDEHETAAVLHQSVKVLRRQRSEGVGPRYIKLNGCTVRYRLADLQSFLAAQPTGGGVATEAKRGPGRPKKTAA
jgi:hypothetical protein